jgi:hypothetical protein
MKGKDGRKGRTINSRYTHLSQQHGSRKRKENAVTEGGGRGREE